MSTINVNAQLQGLNQVLAAMAQLQNVARDITRAANNLQGGGTSGSSGGNRPPAGSNSAGGTPNLNGRGGSGSNNLQAIRDTARRESGAIVAAYAEVASTIFATTAAFNALKEAAQFGTLLTAQRNFAKETGTNMQSVAKSLQEVARYSVSFQEATQFASVGRLAGFTTKQIKELTQTGISAATILGRDIPDALSRMFRGVAKGEPEILDELGIFIRLDNAYKAYVESHAKGQKVFELSAYQRRQATFYAAQEAGKQMREGNADIQPDEFTKAAAQFSTAFKEGMLTFANVVSPVVKLFAENTELLLGALAVLFRTPLRNLGNILVNQTQANNRVEAAKLRADELRARAEQMGTQSRELWAQNRATMPQLRTRDQITRLEQEAFRAEADAMAKRYDLLEKYEKQLRRRLNSSRLTDAEKTDIRNQLSSLTAQNVAEMARNNTNNTKGVREALAATTAATINAVNAQNRAAETLPLTWRRAGTVVRTELASIGSAAAAAAASLARVGAAANIHLAQASAMFTRFLGAMGSLASSAALLYMVVEGTKAIGDYAGLTSGKVGDLAKEFGEADKRILDTLSSLGKLQNSADTGVSLRNAEIIANVYDSLSTDIDALQKKMEGINFGEWKVGSGDVENFNKVMQRTIPLLDQAAKKRVAIAVQTSLGAGYDMQQSGIGRVVRSGVGKSGQLSTQMEAEKQKLTALVKGENGIEGVLHSGIVLPIYAAQQGMKQLAKELAKTGEGAKYFSDSLKDSVQTMEQFKESVEGIAKTAIAESPFNTAIEKLKTAKFSASDAIRALSTNIPNIGFVTQEMRNPEQLQKMQAQLEGFYNRFRDIAEDLNDTKLINPEMFQLQTTGDPLKDVVANYNRFVLLASKSMSAIQAKEKEVGKDRDQYLTSQARKRTADLDNKRKEDQLARKYDVAALTAHAKELGDIYNELENKRLVVSTAKDLGAGRGISDALQVATGDVKMLASETDNSASVIIGRLKDLTNSYEFTAKELGMNLRVTESDATKLANVLINAMGGVDKVSKAAVSAARNIAEAANSSAMYKQALRDLGISEVTEANLTTALTNARNGYNRELGVSEAFTLQLAEATKAGIQQDTKRLEAFKDNIAELEKYTTLTYQAKIAAESFSPTMSMATFVSSELNESLLTLGDSISTAFQPQLLAEFVQRTRQAIRQVAVSKASSAADLGIKFAKDPNIQVSALNPAQLGIRRAYLEVEQAKLLLKQGITSSVDGIIEANNALLAAEQAYKEALVNGEVARANAAADTKDWTRELEVLTKVVRKSSLLEAWAGFVDDATTILAEGKGKNGETAARALKDSGLGRLSEWATKNIKTQQDAAFKWLGKTITDKFKASDFMVGIGKLKTEFPKFTGALSSSLPYLGQLVANRNDRNARMVSGGGLIGNAAGFAIGGPVGAAIGGAIGSLLGSAFTKKIKEVGAQINVSASGIATGFEAELIKRRRLFSSSTKMKYGNALDAELMGGIQDSVDKIREGYRAGLLQFSMLTGNAFGELSANSGAFTKNYMQKPDAGGDMSSLLKGFSKDFGTWLASNQDFLYEFKDATESLADTLIRLVDTMKVTDSAFTTLFDLSSGSIIDRESVDSYIGGMASALIKDIRGSYEANVRSEYYGDDILLGDKFADRLISDFNTDYAKLFDSISARTPKQSDIDLLSRLTETVGSVTWTPAFEQAKVVDLTRIAKYFYDGSTALELVRKAQLAFYDDVVKIFDGADINAKREAYKAALSTYTSVASVSVVALSDSLSAMTMDLSTSLSKVAGTSNGKLRPIAEFNRDLKKLISDGASAEDIGKALKLGANLATAINNILDAFSAVDINKATNASTFASTVSEGISTTFKQSAIESFKKGLLAPLYADVLDAVATGTFNPTTEEYSNNSAPIISSAQRMVSVLSNSEFKKSLNSISVEFEKLIKVLGSAEAVAAISSTFYDISKDMKLAAYSFSVDGNATSVALFKAMEALKAAGVSADIAKLPLGQAVEKLKAVADAGGLSADGLANVNDALKSTAEYSIAARDELVKVRDVSSQVYEATSNSIKSIAYAIIDDSQSLDAAKTAITSLMSISGDKVTAAKNAYDKAQQLGNSLTIEEKALAYANSIDSSMALQVEYLDKLKDLTTEKYNLEKEAYDELINSVTELRNLAEEIKFDETLSILKPTDRLKASELNFEQLRDKVLKDAASGNFSPEGLAKFQEESRRVLELGREVYASGDSYTKLYNTVMGSLDKAAVDASAQAALKEAALKKYQDESLAYAKQSRDIQLASLGTLSNLSKASVVDNAISVDLLNAIKYNSGLPQGVMLSDYYNKLFTASQSAASSFTTIETGYPEFSGIGNYNTANTQQQEVIISKVTEAIDKLNVVLANLPIDVKNAIQSTTSLTTKRT